MPIFLKRLVLILCAIVTPLTARALTAGAYPAPTIAISPNNATVGISGTMQYAATVSGVANAPVTWMVNGTPGGNSTIGTISTSGLYTAPATVPSSTPLVVAVTSTQWGMVSVNIVASGPAISAVTPNPIPVGNYSITVSGSGFQPGATVFSGGVQMPTIWVNASTLKAYGYQGSAGAGAVEAKNPGGSLGTPFPVNFGASTASIAPTAASVPLGGTKQFTATGATSWTTSSGSISAAGLYTAPTKMPASSSVSVTASGESGASTAVVTLTAASSCSASPASVTLSLSQTQQFVCPQVAVWQASAGTITSSGLYTAPATMPSSSAVTITGIGTFGTTTASVTLTGSTATQTISPSSVSVTLGKTQQFTSTGATGWSTTAGSISSSGLYTAPTTMPSSSTASVTATGPGGTATATISLVSGVTAQTISPSSVSVTLGQTQQFTSSGATGWTATAGSVSSTGLYTAPATMPSSSTASVTATGPGGTATATVSLVSAVTAQTISPSAVSITLGQTQQFLSTGATSWTATAGSISSAGLYTAPTTMPSSSTASVTATGPNGSATATISLVAAVAASTGTVSITTINPLYGWQVIPGATRRIHATVTGGSSSQVNWSYSTTGGASATITPAVSPNIPGAFVDVTVGLTGSACTNVGSSTSPVFSSAATVVLKATSVDDPTKSTTVPINVCNPTAQVFISPFNVRLYSGQKVDLQSWVWGAVNDNVTWSISQPAGGNGQFTAPPAGGSATTARDAVFSATVAGNYTVTATSVANPSASATAILSVSSNALPSYAITPNHTEPVDCSVDPTLTGKTYDIGAGHPYAMLADAYVAIGSNVLSPGTTIRLFNTDTTGTNPTRYHEYLRLDGQGTQAQPIRIVGCADSAGNLPIMDAQNATSYSPTDNSVAAQIAGLYQIGIHHSNGFAVYPTINSPSYIVIEGIAFRNAYPTTSNGGATSNYYNPGTSSATAWGTSASCIRPYEGNHLTVRGNDMQDCSFGILADFNGNNGWGGFFGDFDLQGNYFNNIGASNQSEHMAYVQGFRQVIQDNVFDTLKSVSAAGELKMRGVGEVVRYNFFNTTTNTRTIDFVEEQDSNMYMSFLGYYYTPAGNTSFHNEYPSDAYTPDMIAAGDEAWHKAYAYGNIVNFGPNTPSSDAPIHFFGDQSPYTDQNTNPPVRVGDLFDYSNTFYSVGGTAAGGPPNFNLVDTMQNEDNQIRWEWPTLTIWNNAIYSGPLNTTANQGFQMSTLRSDFYNLGPNWLSSNWGNNTQTCTNISCWAGTGWPWYEETTQYMDGGNLPAHITGAANLITGGTTIPFSTTNFIPTTGGGLVGAGAALPATVSNMPVRFQMTAPSYVLTPRANPLTLGAHD